MGEELRGGCWDKPSSPRPFGHAIPRIHIPADRCVPRSSSLPARPLHLASRATQTGSFSARLPREDRTRTTPAPPPAPIMADAVEPQTDAAPAAQPEQQQQQPEAVAPPKEEPAAPAAEPPAAAPPAPAGGGAQAAAPAADAGQAAPAAAAAASPAAAAEPRQPVRQYLESTGEPVARAGRRRPGRAACALHALVHLSRIVSAWGCPPPYKRLQPSHARLVPPPSAQAPRSRRPTAPPARSPPPLAPQSCQC